MRFLQALARQKALLAIAGLLTLSGCATNTMTGRNQLSLVSDAQISQRSSSQYTAMETDYRRKQKLITSGPIKDRVDVITNRLIEQAVLYRPESRDWNWRVMVIDDPKTVNAFCMPGGLMGIYTGFFEKMKASDDEIAQVMGHEIGHALAGHGAEKMSNQIASSMAVVIISAALSRNSREFNDNQAVMTMGALAFINLPNGRATETEADRIGIELAARAGYRPEAATELWTKMAQNEKGGSSDFFRTHPSPANRAEALNELAVPMRPMYQQAVAQPKPPYNWLYGPSSGRPAVDPSQAIALYSPAWERFKAGAVELKNPDSPGYLFKQRELKDHHDKNRWRDLAVKVMETDYPLDLNYYYLGRAAYGLGHNQAGSRYMTQAGELSRSESTACAKKRLIGCSGIDVATSAADTSFIRPVATSRPVPVVVPAAMVMPVVATPATAVQPASPVISEKPPLSDAVGQDSGNVERMVRGPSCAASPRALLQEKGPGFERYTVKCDGGEVLSFRCEFGNCVRQ